MEQMKINILDGTQNMAPDGREVLRSMQNSSTPILDLFVRESIQNSLDASRDPKRTVSVEFLTGKFCPESLNPYFEEISESLNKRFPKESYSFLSIRDKGTNGLTGKVSKEEIGEKEDLGNLIKLIYDIRKPQSGEGAGGSWGIGKTIYYKLGVGLVIFYSCIQNKQKNTYEHRMAACMIEDQTRNAILPSFRPGTRKSGIAWWGDKLPSKNNTIPITDKKFIKQILKVFGIELYQDEPGTTVIIPYLKESLLTDNVTLESDGYFDKPRILTWHHSLDAYLRESVLRWYSPRLNNKFYPYGSKLQASINGVQIKNSDFSPAYQYMQALYTRAAASLPDDYTDCLDDSNFGVEEIKLNNLFNDGSTAGFVSWCKISKEDLHICPPDNLYDPYSYFDIEVKDNSVNKPILAFCRKPGMLVSYVQDGDWLSGVPSPNEGEYIFAVFVLNSMNTLKSDSTLTLDEYARQGERADHINWEDHSLENDNPKLISKIQNRVSKKLAEALSVKEDDQQTRRISGLSEFLGKLMLPPEGFGHAPLGTTNNGGRGGQGGTDGRITGSRGGNGGGGGSDGGNSDGSNSGLGAKHPISISFLPAKTKYDKDKVTYFYYVKTTAKCSSCKVDVKLVQEGGKIDMSEWTDDYGFKPPFELSSVEIHMLKVDKKETDKTYKSASGIPIKLKQDVDIALSGTRNGTKYSSSVTFNVQKSYEFELKICLLIKSREVKPFITVS